MYGIIIAFLGKRVFSTSGAFLIPIIGLFGFILLWNLGDIMEKFGYESKSSLIRQVSELRETNRTNESELVRLNNLVVKLNSEKKLKDDIYNNYKSSVEVTVSKKDSIVETSRNEREKIKEVKDKINTDLITLEDKLSLVNIEIIHKTFYTFFEE